MSYLVTGVAGFMGFSLSKQLLERGDNVVGLDNINDYYDANTKMSFSVYNNVDHPVSLCAASKKVNELMAPTYLNLCKLACKGLRLFTYTGYVPVLICMFLFAGHVSRKANRCV